jgi:hypothetical protein
VTAHHSKMLIGARKRALLATCAALAMAALTLPGSASSEQIVMRTLSIRPDLVTGTGTRVEVDVPAGQTASRVRITLNGKNVTGAFRKDGRRLVGVVTDLVPGRNEFRAMLPDGAGAHLSVTDHPLSGPLFAGPQVQPWACTTTAHGLGAPADRACDARHPVVSYQYKDAVSGQLATYDPHNPPAAGRVATTRTDRGQTVPYIVRVTRGTLDRSIYDIAVLARGWNNKLYVPFGGSCSAKHSQTAPAGIQTGPAGIEVSQSAPDGAVLLDHQLARGWAVATSGLQTLGQNCNPTVSAESLVMLKQQIGDSMGPIRYTIGAGCSGGSVQVMYIADTYPGLLDGIIPICSFPDLWTPAGEVADCLLLDTYMNQTSPHLWADPDARSAVLGQASPASCLAFATAFGRVLDPTNNNDPVTGCDVPTAQMYNAKTNRHGVRCTVQDYQRAIWGSRGRDGFARRPLDNVGVQYGLQALESGRIFAEQFVDLNEKIGGLSIDGQVVPQREVADPTTVYIAYRTNEITSGRNLAGVPIIDLRGTGNEEIHLDYHSYSTRERLRTANGDAANQVIWTTATDSFATVGRDVPIGQLTNAFDTLDSWLAAVEADHRGGSLRVKVRRDRPAAAVDACFVGTRKIVDAGTCTALFPHFGNARIAAGGPLANDVVKCSLKPLARADYDVIFTDSQWARLRTAFPTGICDWRTTAAAHRPAPLTWPTFADGPGGRPLRRPPASAAFGPSTAPRTSGAGGDLAPLGGRGVASQGQISGPASPARRAARQSTAAAVVSLGATGGAVVLLLVGLVLVPTGLASLRRLRNDEWP